MKPTKKKKVEVVATPAPAAAPPTAAAEDGGDDDFLISGGGMGMSAKELEAMEYARNFHPRPFDPRLINIDAACAIIGKRRFGKTVWAQWVLSFLWVFFREAYVFTTTKNNLFWSQHVPDNAIYEGLQVDVITQILKRQDAIVERMAKEGSSSKITPHILMVFEDVASEEHEMKYANELKRLLFNGRHKYVFVIFMIQDLKTMGPALRGNMDFVALTYQNQGRTMEAAQDNWGDWWSNKWVFRELVRLNCQDHGMLVISQPNAVYDPRDQFYSSTAPDPEDETENPPYRLGYAEQWMELGNDWAEQLARYSRLHSIQKRSREEWAEIAVSNFDKGEEVRREVERAKKQHSSDHQYDVVSNQLAAASADKQADVIEAVRKRMPPDSNSVKATKMWRDAIKFKEGPEILYRKH